MKLKTSVGMVFLELKTGAAGIFLLLLLLIPLVISCGKKADDKPPIATVKNSSVSEADLISRYNLEEFISNSAGKVSSEMLREAARKWAFEQILMQEGDKLNLDQDQLFNERLAAIRREMLIQSLYDHYTMRVSVDSTEIRNEYDANRTVYSTASDQIYFLYVITPDREQAQEVRRSLQSGAEISEAIATDDSFTGEETGWIEKSDLDSEIAKTAFSLLPGGISYPLKLKGDAGYIVMMCRERRQSGTVLPLEEVYKKIHQRLLSRKRINAEIALRDSLWAVYKPQINVNAD
ncbi:hypothetical protein CEE37_04635 [candidate division LCP-89 bacterium B3_LCP]|uniref:peptidylprolyl isomerase n=1 Tax=candidate division LCP-89 bacterium B3_LCP TaxID=2012998 RepID=A0A532V3X7_UNCL8|nr:MAG: hypothetical protein CEE37_04635 [candidate division LCP-89 bacterium B3_LCP]